MDHDDGGLLPARKIGERYGVCAKTIKRWTEDPDLRFPKLLWINNRQYGRLADLVAWERARTAGKTPEAA
jgi:hypothetical protein